MAARVSALLPGEWGTEFTLCAACTQMMRLLQLAHLFSYTSGGHRSSLLTLAALGGAVKFNGYLHSLQLHSLCSLKLGELFVLIEVVMMAKNK